MAEVEDRAGTARDGATDDGHALGGQLGAGLGGIAVSKVM
jgi:hypothetical protein